MATAVVVVVVAVAVVWAVARSSDDSVQTVRAAALGVSADVPGGWSQQARDSTRLFLYTDQSFIDENCSSSSDYTTVLLTVSRQADASASLVPIPRPQHFDDTQGTGIETDKDFADLACGSTGWAVAFTDHGRTFVANATFGRDASPARRAEAYRILDGLNVADQ